MKAIWVLQPILYGGSCFIQTDGSKVSHYHIQGLGVWLLIIYTFFSKEVEA